MLCPRCEQDDVLRVIVKKNNQELFVCPECEASWLSANNIKDENFFDFVSYMRTLELRGSWSDVIIQASVAPISKE